MGWAWLLLRILAALAVLASSVLVLPVAPAIAAPDGLTATEVSFVGDGGVVLHGTVLAPVSTPQRRPAVVMVEGAGNRGRQELRLAAGAFAQRGIVTLFYDKRTEGYNLLRRDYSVLADDALAGLRLLRSRADVDPARLGMWALSEGAFVAPLAASRSTDVKFLITVGAVGMTPAAQTASCYDERLRHADVSGSFTHTMRVTAVRMTIGAGIFPEALFDPAPAWERVRQPVLAQWGELDREALPMESSQIIRQALERAGNRHYTIRFVPEVRHNLYVTANGGFDRLASIPANYGDYEASWIDRLTHTLPNASAEPAPPQHAPSPTFTPLAWYESPWLQLAALLLFLVAFAGYPLTAAVRRIRGRRGAPPVRHPARWLAATGLATTMGFLVYLFFVLATAAAVVGPVLIGRPIAWLVLQVLAVATVVATVATGLSWRRHRRDLTRADRARLGLLAAAGLLFLPWAAYWGLLIP
ncbi:alpha/beta hydrolase family protein [Micromonospora luteifusca]|uniref:alpha/beta hydrolase family protein n=1 Tax=Micromonospora luteifusca TaxID=709860 RepID=UPI0033BAB24D